MTIKRTRRTAAQWHQLVEAQIASGLSAPKFCQQHSINYPSLISWKKKLSNAQPNAAESIPTFIELTPPVDAVMESSSAQTAPAMNIELDFGDGLQLRIQRAR